MFEGWGLHKKTPGEKREIIKPKDAKEAPVIIAQDALGNPIRTASSTLDAEKAQTENAEGWKEAA